MVTGIPNGTGKVFYRGAKPWGRWGKYESPLSKWHNYARDGELDSPAKEEDALGAMRQAIRAGLFYDAKHANKNKSVAQVIDEYVAEQPPSQASRHQASLIAIIRRELGKHPIKACEEPPLLAAFKQWLKTTPMEIVRRYKVMDTIPTSLIGAQMWTGEWREERTLGTKLRSNRTINLYLERLQDIMLFARGYKYIDQNPFDVDPRKTLRKEKHARGRKRGLSFEEEAKLIAAMTADNNVFLRECFDVTLATGLRVGELLHLQWKHVDLTEWELHLDAAWTKTREARSIPIEDPAIRAIFEAKKKTFMHPDDYVFTSHIDRSQQKSIKKTWNATLRRAGLADSGLHWHDLRGEAGTRMLANVPDDMKLSDAIKQVQQVLGHAPGSKVTEEAYINRKTDKTLLRRLVGGKKAAR